MVLGMVDGAGRVSGSLRAGGHEVYAPTLTGLCDQYHLTSPDTRLETHVLDIVNFLKFEDLYDVTLVGHIGKL